MAKHLTHYSSAELQAGEDQELREKIRPLFEREHYSMLVKIKKYKGAVSPELDEAISFLGSTHDTNEWGVYKPVWKDAGMRIINE